MKKSFVLYSSHEKDLLKPPISKPEKLGIDGYPTTEQIDNKLTRLRETIRETLIDQGLDLREEMSVETAYKLGGSKTDTLPDFSPKSESPVSPNLSSKSESPNSPNLSSKSESPVSPEIETIARSPKLSESTSNSDSTIFSNYPSNSDSPILSKLASKSENPINDEVLDPQKNIMEGITKLDSLKDVNWDMHKKVSQSDIEKWTKLFKSNSEDIVSENVGIIDKTEIKSNSIEELIMKVLNLNDKEFENLISEKGVFKVLLQLYRILTSIKNSEDSTLENAKDEYIQKIREIPLGTVIDFIGPGFNKIYNMTQYEIVGLSPLYLVKLGLTYKAVNLFVSSIVERLNARDKKNISPTNVKIPNIETYEKLASRRSIRGILLSGFATMGLHAAFEISRINNPIEIKTNTTITLKPNDSINLEETESNKSWGLLLFLKSRSNYIFKKIKTKVLNIKFINALIILFIGLISLIIICLFNLDSIINSIYTTVIFLKKHLGLIGITGLTLMLILSISEFILIFIIKDIQISKNLPKWFIAYLETFKDVAENKELFYSFFIKDIIFILIVWLISLYLYLYF